MWVEALFGRVSWLDEWAIYVFPGTRVTTKQDASIEYQFHWSNEGTLNGMYVNAFAGTTLFSLVPPDYLPFGVLQRPSAVKFMIQRADGGDTLAGLPAGEAVEFKFTWPDRPRLAAMNVLHTVTQSTAEVTPLSRDQTQEPTIVEIKKFLRRRHLKAEIQEGIATNHEAIRLSDLSGDSGCVFYTFSIDGHQGVLCSACWNAGIGERMWRNAEEQFFKIYELSKGMGLDIDLGYKSLDPPPTPWLSWVPFPKWVPEVRQRTARAQEVLRLIHPTAWALMDLEREGVIRPPS